MTVLLLFGAAAPQASKVTTLSLVARVPGVVAGVARV